MIALLCFGIKGIMIDANQAYEIFKQMHNEPPMMMMSEGPHYYKSDLYVQDKGYVIIRKDSGNIEYRKTWDSVEMFFWHSIPIPEKIIYFPKLYDDIVEYYEENKSERLLARIYERAFSEVSYNSFDDLDERTYSSKFDYDNIKNRWINIEKYLYSEIRNIIDNEQIEYPPCVLNKWDDPFYRIKPFMVRNGYTDSCNVKRWEKIKN